MRPVKNSPVCGEERIEYTSLLNVLSIMLLGAVGVLGGAALTEKMAGADSAISFLHCGIAWLLLGFSGLMILRQFSSRRAIAYLMFIAVAINVAGTSMLLGVVLPLFSLYGVWNRTGATLIVYFACASVYQVRRSHRHFCLNWEEYKDDALSVLYDSKRQLMKVEPLMRFLNIKADIFLPERVESFRELISVSIIISMIAGLNLRNVYPLFSAFAWGVPALTLTTVLMQMTTYRILLALKLRALEKSSGVNIGSIVANKCERKAPRKKAKK